MQNDPPRLTQTDATLVLTGRWTAAQFASDDVFDATQRALRLNKPPAAWDLSGISQLDHVGAQLLWQRWGNAWPAQLTALPAQRAVLERVAQYTVAQPAKPRTPLRQHFLALGELLMDWVDHAKGFVRLIGQLILNLVALARAPREGPWRDLSGHIYRIGATALPITALVGFLIGVVLAYLTSQQLKQFGANAFIVPILGLSIIRELGPVLAAILLAGRSGSAITAQIGVMRVTDELDAMRVMGISHSFRLVLPRALALAIVMPLISAWTSMAALAGGMLAADYAMDVSPAYFLSALPKAVEASNLVLATAKSVVFGVLIALVGCHFGLRVKPDTQSLGEGTTASVVTAITVVILVDALFAVLFKDVGV
jgi:phospholipid/cholesterol/gamma-HCH transport system permease protein